MNQLRGKTLPTVCEMRDKMQIVLQGINTLLG